MEQVTETEQQRRDRFKKDHPNGTAWDYNLWCGKEFEDFINSKLKEHATRNWNFLTVIGHFDNFMWLQEFTKNAPSSASRSEMGDQIFEAHLKISGIYNSLMNELSRDELDRDPIVYFLDRVTELKQILS